MCARCSLPNKECKNRLLLFLFSTTIFDTSQNFQQHCQSHSAVEAGPINEVSSKRQQYQSLDLSAEASLPLPRSPLNIRCIMYPLHGLSRRTQRNSINGEAAVLGFVFDLYLFQRQGAQRPSDVFADIWQLHKSCNEVDLQQPLNSRGLTSTPVCLASQPSPRVTYVTL